MNYLIWEKNKKQNPLVNLTYIRNSDDPALAKSLREVIDVFNILAEEAGDRGLLVALQMDEKHSMRYEFDVPFLSIKVMKSINL